MSESPASLPVGFDAGEKDQKYDRQLRLWGDHGQLSLQRACVCVVGCTAANCELLKSLVLAGVGSFLIVDDQTATPADVDANYFLDAASAGQWRGAVACRLLLELNPDVRGSHVHLSAAQLLTSASERLTVSSLAVVAADFADECLPELSDLLWEHSVPLIVCRTCGFFGTIRVQTRERLIIESHPDSALPDLRLTAPFPLLLHYLSLQPPLATLTRQQHQHVPYLLLLLHCLQLWRDKYNRTAPPSGRAEKQQFCQLLRELRWRDESGELVIEENFDEAERALNTCFGASGASAELRQLFSRDECCHLTAKSDDFWLLVRALRDFVDETGDGMLPVRGDLPDMFADSKTYVELQSLYREQARCDSNNVLARVTRLLDSVGRTDSGHVIDQQLVRRFCRNAHALRHYVGSRLSQELRKGPQMASTELTAGLCGDSACAEMAVYVVLCAGDRFRRRHRRPAGHPHHHHQQEKQQEEEEDASLVESDAVTLRGCVSEMLSEWGCPSGVSISDDYIGELCRYGGAQIHSVVAFIGGCAAHEAIKLITGQYVPLDNTLVYNAVTSTTNTFKF